MVMIERRRQAEQGLQQHVEIGRRFEILAADHMGDRPGGRRRRPRRGDSSSASPCARSPYRPSARDPRRRSLRCPRDRSAGSDKVQAASAAAAHCRGARREAHRSRCAAPPPHRTGFGRCPDRAASHRDRAARDDRSLSPGRRSQPRYPCGSRSRDRPLPSPSASGKRHGSRKNAQTAGGRGSPRRDRARPGPHRSRPRIRDGSVRYRYPRCAGETGRRNAWRNRH